MTENLTYAKAGVDIDTTDAVKKKMAESIDVNDNRVLNKVGAFASLLEGRFDGIKHLILVFKTEEPGSKQELAFKLGRITSLAYDLVNHLINDLIMMGTTPLYMQDCIVCGKIDPDIVEELVSGMTAACREQGCILVGGETSVQPGVVTEGVYVLTASAIGVVDKDKMIDGSAIREGDTVLCIASNGLHTNGYTLIRRLLEDDPDLTDMDIQATPFLETIMLPHLCYYKAVRSLFGNHDLKGMAHITGGGIQDNLNRILPENLNAEIDLSAIQILQVFRVIQKKGSISDKDMLRTFNMGVGLTVVCSKSSVDSFTKHFIEQGYYSYPIGSIIKGSGKVNLKKKLNWG